MCLLAKLEEEEGLGLEYSSSWICSRCKIVALLSVQYKVNISHSTLLHLSAYLIFYLIICLSVYYLLFAVLGLRGSAQYEGYMVQGGVLGEPLS